jgi:hypothetical protein
MKKIFSGMFNRAHTKADGLVQSQREAVVDLLHFCMSADRDLALVEDKFVTAEAAHFDWEPDVSFEDFAVKSLARAQDAVQSAEARTAYLQDIARRLATTDLLTRAVGLCQQVFVSDGTFAVSERAVFGEILEAFGWPGTGRRDTR